MFRNEVSFSSSKLKLKENCERAYYYYCYASWRGWWNGSSPPKDQRAEEAYKAKYTDNVHTWTGRIVHGQAEWGLRSAMEGRRFSRENLRNTLMEQARLLIDRGLIQARARVGGSPKHRTILFETEMEQALDEAWLRSRVSSRIMALTSEDSAWHGMKIPVNLYMRAMTNREHVVLVEELVQMTVMGIKVYLATDLVMRSQQSPTSHVVIVDWKTGKTRPEDTRQMHYYRAWAQSRGWTDAEPILVYLGDGKTTVDRLKFDEDSRAVLTKDVHDFLNWLKPKLVGGDVNANDPIPNEFKATTNLKTCETCVFQRMCERDGTKPK
jgi:hypothetical protein